MIEKYCDLYAAVVYDFANEEPDAQAKALLQAAYPHILAGEKLIQEAVTRLRVLEEEQITDGQQMIQDFFIDLPPAQPTKPSYKEYEHLD